MKSRSSISFSVRRHFVDDFFFRNSILISKNSKVIDIGGHKGTKRGVFNIDDYSDLVTYVNIEKTKKPDILADAAKIPVADNSFDIAIMGELLEHVAEPKTVLKEAFRLLKPGGKLLISVPFIFPIHSDPFDYGRYTPDFWQMISKELQFSDIRLERHGSVFSVIALIVQHIFIAKKKTWGPVQYPLISFLMWLDKKTSAPLLRNWTTGFGIILTK